MDRTSTRSAVYLKDLVHHNPHTPFPDRKQYSLNKIARDVKEQELNDFKKEWKEKALRVLLEKCGSVEKVEETLRELDRQFNLRKVASIIRPVNRAGSDELFKEAADSLGLGRILGTLGTFGINLLNWILRTGVFIVPAFLGGAAGYTIANMRRAANKQILDPGLKDIALMDIYNEATEKVLKDLEAIREEKKKKKGKNPKEEKSLTGVAGSVSPSGESFTVV